MGWFKEKSIPAPAVDVGFVEPHGTHYIKFLERLHLQMRPDWYLEVGTEKGRSLAVVQGNAIAIDPHFQLDGKLRWPSQLHMFQQTSDDFFAMDFLARNDIRIDLAFLDGMHHFEYLLRDFMNAERGSKPESLILLHDCVPYNHLMAQRDWDKTKTLSWTGDVWKLLPILKRHRPDLKLEILDCAPTGLVLISGLNPASMVLENEYNSIISEWLETSIAQFGIERLLTEFPLVSAENWFSK